jgi:hypothetical protein
MEVCEVSQREKIKPLLDMLDEGRSAEGASFNAKGAGALYSLYRRQANEIDSADKLIGVSARVIAAQKGVIAAQESLIAKQYEIMWLWLLLGLLLGWAVS